MLLLFAEAVLVFLVAVAGGAAALFRVPFRKFFRRGMWTLLLPPFLFAYGFIIERNIYEVKETYIVSERIPEAFDGYRIVQLSDIHLSSFRKRAGSLERAVEKVNGLAPDVILFTGDMITFSPDELNERLMKVLSGLEAPDGIYAVLGNHDYCTYAGYSDEAGRVRAVDSLIAKEESMGWKVLLDCNTAIVRESPDDTGTQVHGQAGADDGRDTLYIAGVRNISASSHFISDGDLDRALEGAGDSFTVLMSHDPSHWRTEVVYRDDIDLMLSGHTHAMQLALFGWSPISFLYKEYSGLYERSVSGAVPRTEADRNTEALRKEYPYESVSGTQYLYVNTGLGETGFPARIGVPPEITLITLKSR